MESEQPLPVAANWFGDSEQEVVYRSDLPEPDEKSDDYHYIAKSQGFDPDNPLHREDIIARMYAIQQRYTARHAFVENVYSQAYPDSHTLEEVKIDAKTGVLTEEALLERIELAANRALNGEISFALVSMDWDKFKVVNDTQGHHMGDELLEVSGKKLRERTRHTDPDIHDEIGHIGRVGGDEFVFLLEYPTYSKIDPPPIVFDTGKHQGIHDQRSGELDITSRAERFCQRIQQDIDEILQDEKYIELIELGAGISVGYTVYNTEEGTSLNAKELAEYLLKAADENLRFNKEERRAELERRKNLLRRLAGSTGRLLMKYNGDYDSRLHG